MKFLNDILDYVGNTPMVKIQNCKSKEINLYAKLEGFNPTGSIKDRAASEVIKGLLNNGTINKDTTIIESSSGNFGIALANYCKKYGLKFICVVDPKILTTNEMIIRNTGAEIIKVHEADSAGGYLLSRIAKVKELQKEIPNSYWINQYENEFNAKAYCNTVGKEICDEIDIDYIFLGVSSGGTITGISNAVKDRYPNAKVIAVDIEGSVVFGQKSKNRSIPGIGSSMVPKILSKSHIDEVVIVNEEETIKSCKRLMKEENIFVGGSSGTVYAAVEKYFSDKQLDKVPNVVAVFADRGDRYSNTIYNDEWCKNLLGKEI